MTTAWDPLDARVREEVARLEQKPEGWAEELCELETCAALVSWIDDYRLEDEAAQRALDMRWLEAVDPHAPRRTPAELEVMLQPVRFEYRCQCPGCRGAGCWDCAGSGYAPGCDGRCYFPRRRLRG
jgi:hypothetical protein